MSDEYSSFDEKRRHLIAEITRQRGELSQAYNNLAKPIHYAEYGLRGFGFLRKNPWVLSVIPAIFSITSTAVGLMRNKPTREILSRARHRHDLEREAEKKSKGIVGHAVRLGGHGWKLFKLYRRVRKFLP
jgi:hypothetical protein